MKMNRLSEIHPTRFENPLNHLRNKSYKSKINEVQVQDVVHTLRNQSGKLVNCINNRVLPPVRLIYRTWSLRRSHTTSRLSFLQDSKNCPLEIFLPLEFLAMRTRTQNTELAIAVHTLYMIGRGRHPLNSYDKV
eukprot:9495574-Pyramimonas_sp.AAC.4